MRQYMVVSTLVLLLLFAGCTLPGTGSAPPAACTSDSSPVCGTNGQTYTNACFAQNASVAVAHTGACTAPNTGACTDGDGGKDIFTASSVLAGGNYYDDACVDASNVKEYFCENGTFSFTEFPCPSGYACTNGACLLTPCTDTDGGAIAETRGTAAAAGSSSTDSCETDSSVKEYYCSGGSVLSRTMDCGTGSHCVNGACVAYTCTDSDNGQNENTAGSVTLGSTTSNDTCVDASTVKEYYCEAGQIKNKNIACASGKVCQAGSCITQPLCTDSDGGQDKYTKGTTTFNGTTYPDACVDTDTVAENYCDSTGKGATAQIACGSGYTCLQGACVASQCTATTKDLSDDADVRTSLKTGTSITLYEGEQVEVSKGSTKYYLSLDSVSGDTATLILYKANGDNICSEDITANDSNDDLCSKGISVDVNEVGSDYAKLGVSYSAVQITTEEGTRKTYTGTGCPADNSTITKETSEFYPRFDIDSGLNLGSSKKIVFLGVLSKVTALDLDTGTLTLDFNGDSVDLQDGDTLKYNKITYTISLGIDDNGLHEIVVEK